jgi:hypothetical protein
MQRVKEVNDQMSGDCRYPLSSSYLVLADHLQEGLVLEILILLHAVDHFPGISVSPLDE